MAEAGDNIGALLRGIAENEIERGQVLCKARFHSSAHQVRRPGLRSDRKKRAAVIRRSSTDYRPQFYFRTTDVTGIIKLPEGVEMCMPGDNVEMDC